MKSDLNPRLTIDPEFETLCPPLLEAELIHLRQNLAEDGCRDALIVWECDGDEILIDGHNRFRLCNELGISFETRSLPLEDRAEAKRWIIANQLGRRNITPEQTAYLRGVWHEGIKGERGGNHGNQHTQAKGTNCTLPNAAKDVAAATGVSERTVKNDAKFARAVDHIAREAGSEVKNEILLGRSGLTKAEVTRLDGAGVRDIEAAVSAKTGRARSQARQKPPKKASAKREPLKPWAHGYGFTQRAFSLRQELKRTWSSPESAANIAELLGAVRFAIQHRAERCAKRGIALEDQLAWLNKVRTSVGYLAQELEAYAATLEAGA